MKKFKIFLMLSILLCIGFALSFEVHASGPKIFEAGEVLPATTQLKISWDSGLSSFLSYGSNYRIDCLTGDSLIFAGDPALDGETIVFWIRNSGFQHLIIYQDGWEQPYTDYSGGHNYIVIDTSSWNVSRRTIDYIKSLDCLYWEDLNAPSVYTITYEENGGTTIPDIEEATELPDPLPISSKSGYTFAGWYYDDDFTTQAYAGDELEDDVTLYAKWILNTYTITYNSNGGSVIPQTSDATQLPYPLPIPTKEGSTFVNWYYDSAYTQIAIAGDPIESDVTLYALWRSEYTKKIFEVGDLLSPGQIKISWDFSDITISEDDFIRIEGTNDFAIYMAVEDVANSVEMLIMGYYTDTIKGNVMISLDSISVITEIKSDGNSNFWHILDVLTWEYIGDYQDGYSTGYALAREDYGYYDSSTDEWLTVTEYINRYGTDKMNQTDFYNNFDKYFIPAMIIVFGGAIVLTILKVFNKRE